MTCTGGITITTIFDGSTPRRIVAVRYRCAACRQEWDHLPLAAALRARTSSPFDRQCERHWKECPEREEPA